MLFECASCPTSVGTYCSVVRHTAASSTTPQRIGWRCDCRCVVAKETAADSVIGCAMRASSMGPAPLPFVIVVEVVVKMQPSTTALHQPSSTSIAAGFL